MKMKSPGFPLSQASREAGKAKMLPETGWEHLPRPVFISGAS